MPDNAEECWTSMDLHVSMSFPKMVNNKTDSKCLSNKAFQPRAPETSLFQSPNPFRKFFHCLWVDLALKLPVSLLMFPYHPPGFVATAADPD